MKSSYILIVDDDPNIREGLTREVEREFDGKAIVLNCKNGKIAADLLKCNTIDILVTDIKMPVMNGIELLEFLQENRIFCKSVVLSSYDDFNLVRDAMRAGAADYMLKPVDFPALFRVLYKLLGQVMMERTRPANTYFPLNMQNLLETYVQKLTAKTPELLAFEEKYMLQSSSLSILGCVKIESFSSSQMFKMQELIREDLYNCLNKAHIRYHTILTGELASCFVFLLLPETPAGLCLDALTLFRDSLSLHNLQCVVSENYLTLKESSLAFHDCLTQFEQGFYDLPDSCPDNMNRDEPPGLLLGRLAESLNRYDLTAALHELTDFFILCMVLRPSVTEIRKMLNNMIYELLQLNSKYIEPLSQSKFSEHDIFRQIETAPCLSLLKKDLFDSLNYLVGAVLSNLPEQDDCIIEKAKLYIKENYNDCITLDDVAAHVYLNKSYFSVFFKNKVGLTYREYLRNYRIQQAIGLIRDTHMKVYEIAQAVGYNDSAHFIRAFKTVTGKNPSDYKPL